MELGPTFADEIAAAGLSEVVYSWQPDTGIINFRDRLTPEQDELLDAIVAAHKPDARPSLPRSVAMWRARTIMKVTPWGGGTLFDAVQGVIAGLTDPLQKAAAEEALERGTDFDRDGVFVPMLAQIVGISGEQLDELMAQAAVLPA